MYGFLSDPVLSDETQKDLLIPRINYLQKLISDICRLDCWSGVEVPLLGSTALSQLEEDSMIHDVM